MANNAYIDMNEFHRLQKQFVYIVNTLNQDASASFSSGDREALKFGRRPTKIIITISCLLAAPERSNRRAITGGGDKEWEGGIGGKNREEGGRGLEGREEKEGVVEKRRGSSRGYITNPSVWIF